MKFKFYLENKKGEDTMSKNTKNSEISTPRNHSYYDNNIRTKKQETRMSSRPGSHDETQVADANVLAKPDKAIYREKCKSIENRKIMAAKSILMNADNLFRIDVSVVNIVSKEKEGKSLTGRYKQHRPRINIGIVESSGHNYCHLTSNLVPPDRYREISHNAGKHAEFYNNVKEFAEHLNNTNTTYAGKVRLRQDKFYKHQKLIVPKMAAFMCLTGNTPTILIQIGDQTFHIKTDVYTGKDHKFYPYKGHIQFEDTEEYIEL